MSSEESVMRTVDDIEHEIKAVDVVLRLLRADGIAAETLDNKLLIQKHVRHVEGMRAKLRRELFAAMDEGSGSEERERK